MYLNSLAYTDRDDDEDVRALREQASFLANPEPYDEPDEDVVTGFQQGRIEIKINNQIDPYAEFAQSSFYGQAAKDAADFARKQLQRRWETAMDPRTSFVHCPRQQGKTFRSLAGIDFGRAERAVLGMAYGMTPKRAAEIADVETSIQTMDREYKLGEMTHLGVISRIDSKQNRVEIRGTGAAHDSVLVMTLDDFARQVIDREMKDEQHGERAGSGRIGVDRAAMDDWGC